MLIYISILPYNILTAKLFPTHCNGYSLRIIRQGTIFFHSYLIFPTHQAVIQGYSPLLLILLFNNTMTSIEKFRKICYAYIEGRDPAR